MENSITLLVTLAFITTCHGQCSPRLDIADGLHFPEFYNVTSSRGNPLRALHGTFKALRGLEGEDMLFAVEATNQTHPVMGNQGDFIVEKFCFHTKNVQRVYTTIQGGWNPPIRNKGGALAGTGPGLTASIDTKDPPAQWTRTCKDFKGVFSRIEMRLRPTWQTRPMIKAVRLHACPRQKN